MPRSFRSRLCYPTTLFLSHSFNPKMHTSLQVVLASLLLGAVDAFPRIPRSPIPPIQSGSKLSAFSTGFPTLTFTNPTGFSPTGIFPTGTGSFPTGTVLPPFPISPISPVPSVPTTLPIGTTSLPPISVSVPSQPNCPPVSAVTVTETETATVTVTQAGGAPFPTGTGISIGSGTGTVFPILSTPFVLNP